MFLAFFCDFMLPRILLGDLIWWDSRSRFARCSAAFDFTLLIAWRISSGFWYSEMEVRTKWSR